MLKAPHHLHSGTPAGRGHVLDILYADEHIVVVSKPGGLLSVPGRTQDRKDCVVTRLQDLYPDMIKQPAVHRLDMATSGLMVVAKTKDAHRNLSHQFASQQTQKRYVAILEGSIEESTGRIELPFRVDIYDRPHQIYDPIHGKIGVTLWRKISSSNGQTRVSFIPLTGRTHQLRLHAAHKFGLAAPIVGDPLYGRGEPGDRLLLHASVLSFFHPETNNRMRFSLPPDF